MAAERADLADGDVPLFTTRPGARDLWDSRGRRIDGFFAEDGLARVRRDLSGLGARDREEQTGLIRKAMLTLERRAVFRRGAATEGPADEPTPGDDRPLPSPREWLEAATVVGEHLQAQATFGDEDVTWIGLSLRLSADSDSAWDLTPLSPALYDGIGGLALFFGWLGAATGRGEFTDLARRGAHRLRAAARAEPGHDVATVSAFWGRSAGLYVLAHLAALWDSNVLHDVLDVELDRLSVLIPEDTAFDVLGGAAGCAMVLLGLAERDARCLELARRCGEHLLSHAIPQPRGVGWVGNVSSSPLAGFSHSTAGIAWALAELSDVLGDARLASLARRAIEYERSLYVPEERDWLDRRLEPRRHRPMQRLVQRRSRRGAGTAPGPPPRRRHRGARGDRGRDRAHPAVRLRCRSQPLPRGHGQPRDPAPRRGRPRPGRLAAGRSPARARGPRSGGCRRQWRCGLPRRLEVPSFMTGLAGVGYAMLRLWSEDVPSVLKLEGARESSCGAAEPRRRGVGTRIRYIDPPGKAVPLRPDSPGGGGYQSKQPPRCHIGKARAGVRRPQQKRLSDERSARVLRGA